MFVNRFEKLWKKIRKLGKKRNHFQRISNSHTTTSISLGAALSGIAREAVIETPQKPTVTGVNFYDSRIRNTRHNLKIGQEKEGGGREAPPYRYIDTWCVNINGKGINSPLLREKVFGNGVEKGGVEHVALYQFCQLSIRVVSRPVPVISFATTTLLLFFRGRIISSFSFPFIHRFPSSFAREKKQSQSLSSFFNDSFLLYERISSSLIMIFRASPLSHWHFHHSSPLEYLWWNSDNYLSFHFYFSSRLVFRTKISKFKSFC